jgi:hypothetical protein
MTTTTPRPGRRPARAVQWAAAILPADQRQRYALEFIADLYGMPPRQQLRHTLGVLSSALALRAALARTSPAASQGDIMVTTPTRPLRCRAGLHRWHTANTTDGLRYDSCQLCGKDRGERYSGFVSGGSGIPGM